MSESQCASSASSTAAKCKRKPCSANPVSILVTIPVCTSGWVHSVPLISISTGPTGCAEQYKRLAVNQLITLREGSGIVKNQGWNQGWSRI
jgi:hypothetical protein